MQVELCNYKDTGIEVHVHAFISDGQLKIEGQDLGKTVSAFWGDSDYEYFYSLSKEDTRIIHKLLSEGSTSQGNLLELIKINFSGVDGCRRFRAFCDKHLIKYNFNSY